MRYKPVLIIQHAEHEHPATIERILQAQGISYQIVHVYKGDSIPEANEIKGIISLGGPMGANDVKDHPWIKPEIKLLKDAIRAKKPVIGICLGGQLMARALGARVTINPVAEVGWHPIQLNDHGKKDPILQKSKSPLGPRLVYQWHNDTFEVPKNADALAYSKACQAQAYRLEEHAYGFQFHPEADAHLVHEWLSIDGVENEILDALEKFGPKTVQNSLLQRKAAAVGELSNIRITTAFCQLFRDDTYDSAPESIKDQIKKAINSDKSFRLKTKTLLGGSRSVSGKLINFFTLPSGSFCILKLKNGSILSLRTDDIIEVTA